MIDNLLKFDTQKAPNYAVGGASDFVSGGAERPCFELEAPTGRAVYIMKVHASQGADLYITGPTTSTEITAALANATARKPLKELSATVLIYEDPDCLYIKG